MDFSWSTEQHEHYQRMLQGAREHFGQMSPSSQVGFTRDQWRICGELGLLGLSAPQHYGGGGLGALDTARLVEAFGRGCTDMGLTFSAAAHLFACVMPIAEFGSEAVKQRLLPGMCSGTLVGANAITEPEAGSDVFALKAGARREGDVYVLNGHKNYVSNAPAADVFVVYATLNPAHGYLGVTGFVVERDTPGLTIGEPFSKMGLTTTPGSAVTFEDCRVPVEQRIGNEGHGGQIFRRSMQWERACLTAMYLGMLDRQLEQTVAFAQKRRQFGRAIGKNQAVSHRIADMKLRLESARLLLYHACWVYDQGNDAVLEVSLAKLALSEAAVQSSLDAIQIHGGVGYLVETGVEQMLRDSIPSTIFSGTSEVQRDLVAKGLGL